MHILVQHTAMATDIHTDVDAFEKPSDLFQTCMNNYVPPSEDQLQILRYMVVYSPGKTKS